MPRAGSILKKKSLRSLDSQLAPALLLLTIIIHKIVEKFLKKKEYIYTNFCGGIIFMCVCRSCEKFRGKELIRFNALRSSPQKSNSLH